MVHVVLLSGGSGTRLWPLSNVARSKQFLKILHDDYGVPCSMVQRTAAHLDEVDLQLDVSVVTNADQRYLVDSQLGKKYEVVVEPERRNTAPAIMLACAHLLSKRGCNEEDTVIVMPIDSFAEQGFFDSIALLNDAVEATAANIVLLGVTPTQVSEKYGYILLSDSKSNGIQKVSRFEEKPDRDRAAAIIEQGGLWNCGVFAFRLSYINRITQKYINDTSYESLKRNYALLPNNSFDYEVLESEDSLGVIQFSGQWKDLGTWDELSSEMSYQASGRVICSDVDNSVVINETAIPMIVSGLSDVVAVATQDGILVSSKSTSATIKKDVEKISVTRPMYEKRRWGEYRVVDSRDYPNGQSSLTKELLIYPGKQISYQRHRERSEVWTVASGNGKVVLDGEVIKVSPGSVLNINPQVMHAVYANDALHIIEVQLGTQLVEDDIERFGYFFRKSL